MNNGEGVNLSETLDDWLVLKDGEGVIIRIDRRSQIEIGHQAVERLETLLSSLMETGTATNQSIVLIVAVRALLVKLNSAESVTPQINHLIQ